MININDPEVAYIEETHKKMLLVYWSLGNTCTYACSYCPSRLHDGSAPYQSLEIIQKTLQKLPPSQVIFTGGEPTFHPDFERIVTEAPEHIRVDVISNASRPIAFWERIVDRFTLVTLTFHAEYADLDRFFKTAELVYKKSGRRGAINLTMIPALWDKCMTAYTRFRDAGITVTPKPLIDDFGSQSNKLVSSYTQEQVQWIKNSTNEISSKNLAFYDKNSELLFKTTPAEMLVNGQTNFEGWTCYTPTQYLYVNPEGKTYNTSCKQRQHVGDIYTGFTLSDQPIVCEQSFCWCFTDIQTKKVKNVIPLIKV
jgi:hypothetical protein